jgi:hypothetical protein
MNDQDFLLTRHQAARWAGVSYNTILLWIRAGRLHPVAEPMVGRPVIRSSELVQNRPINEELSRSVWPNQSKDGPTPRRTPTVSNTATETE